MMRPGKSIPSICTRCLIRSRPFSSTSHQAEQQKHNACPPPPPQAGYTRLTNRGLISITGIDSTTFLQGLITQNMLVANDPNLTPRHTGSYTAFLNSTGRVLNDAFIYPLPKTESEAASTGDPGWLIEIDKNEISSLLKHLKKHKLRSKLQLRALDEGERTVWSSWKDHAEPRWAAYNLESESSSPFSLSSPIAGCVDTRAPGFGSRLITPGDADIRSHLPDESQVAGGEVGLDSYNVRRFLHGVAEGQAEIIRESALPLECNMDMMRGIDFRKGCYVGQELTIRTHHTGVVRKRIVPVQLYAGDQDSVADTPVYDPTTQLPLPPAGSNIGKVDGRRGRSAGKFIGGIGNIGLAICRLEMMTDIVLTGEGIQYNPGEEFKVSWDGQDGSSESGEVKLKALVPSWTREFILGGGVRQNHSSKPTESEGQRAKGIVEELEEEAQRRGE